MNEIGLGEAIKALREELTEAKGEGEGSWMRFQVSPVDLELQLVVTKNAQGKIGWKVLEAGGSVDSARTQKVSLTLTPQWWNTSQGDYTNQWLVSGETPTRQTRPVPPVHHRDQLPEVDSGPEDEH
ncbi:trypco2 family protein [Streptomyces sp. NPDC056486]|uniref:trypco2 family protein n=1 Tax=Streptomyces sp. NPDC056486 TaxID=3345835 RepID=UPI0036A1E62F